MCNNFSKSYHYKSYFIFYTRAIILILFSIPLFAYGQTSTFETLDESNEQVIPSESDTSEEIENPQGLYETLSAMSIPLITITCENNEEPTCKISSAPAGCIGTSIIEANKVPSRVVVSLKDEILYDSGEYVKKESGATVKVRGNTSARRSKKSYKIKLQKKGDLLARGNKNYNDKNWVLIRTGSSLNTRIGYWVGELIEQDWTPAHNVVNVWMNGKYKGLYILSESVESNDKCRIKINEDEGYIIEADPYWWTEDVSFPSNLISAALRYTFKFPDSDDITEEQLENIHNDILLCEEALKNGNYTDYFDVESFAKWMLGWDILGNEDSAGANMFIVKEDSNSKLKMGPIWDFDHAYKGVEDWSAAHNSSIFYYNRLFNAEDPAFHNAYVNLWHKYKNIVFPEVLTRIEDLRNSEEGKDFDKSMILENQEGIVVEDKTYLEAMEGDLDNMCNYLSNWFVNREQWIDMNIPEIKDFTSGVNEISTDNDASLPYFDILSRNVDSSTKGILIHAGKKYLIK